MSSIRHPLEVPILLDPSGGFSTFLARNATSHERRRGVSMPNLASYDVFRTRYYAGATYDGDFEMPVIEGTDRVPERLV